MVKKLATTKAKPDKVISSVLLASSLFPSFGFTYGIRPIERKSVCLSLKELLHLRHGHWEAFYGDIGIEWLEKVFRDQRMVDARVLVLAQARKVLLSYVYHTDT